MSGLTVYAIIIADATGMEPDAMFATIVFSTTLRFSAKSPQLPIVGFLTISAVS